MRSRYLLPIGVCLALLATGCAEPPNKEMDQAQGAIDAARAAGADRFAREAFTAATSALTRAQQAVRDRDYRLALNDALESRDQAQTAAREAADTRARLRGESEALLAQVRPLLVDVETAASAAQRARVPRHVLKPHQDAAVALAATMQEVGSALTAEDYQAVSTRLAAVREQAATTITALEDLTTRQTSRRRR
jgi:flagella basal body P-ring formation protein FlgA